MENKQSPDFEEMVSKFASLSKDFASVFQDVTEKTQALAQEFGASLINEAKKVQEDNSDKVPNEKILTGTMLMMMGLGEMFSRIVQSPTGQTGDNCLHKETCKPDSGNQEDLYQ